MARRRRPPLLPSLLLLGLLAFAVERLVETDREALERWGREAAAALEQGNAEALRGLLSEDFDYGGMPRDEALRYALRERERRGPRAIRIVLKQVEIQRDTARALAWVFATVDGMRYRLQTRVELARGPDGWLLRHAEIAAPY